jgi:DNA-binding CsgD family transcriptional regulator/PAS domain-containing protein
MNGLNCRRRGSAIPEATDAAILSILIGMIYDAALDPACWQQALEAMLADVGLHGGAMSLVALPDYRSMLNITGNMAEPFASSMPAIMPHFAELWGGSDVMLAFPLGEPNVLSRGAGVPADDCQNIAWRDWIRPQGFTDVVGITLARDPFAIGALSMGRHRDGPPITDATVDRLRLYIPHLQRAAAINRLLDLAALREATFEALFDTMSAPVLLVDAASTIVHANRAGRTMIDRDDTLRSRGGTLSAVDRSVHHALAAAIHDATGDYAAIGRKGLGIPFAGNEGVAGALHVLPLRPDHPGGRRLAAIFVAGAGSALAPSASIVGALFGLTPAERAVFEQVANGHHVARTASELGIASSTVRTHLLRIYDKTGVRRQAELVRLSASLAGPASAG